MRQFISEDQLKWVYETDSSDDSILLAGPVFKKKTKKKDQGHLKEDSNDKPQCWNCSFCASCLCHKRAKQEGNQYEKDDEEIELEMIAELQRAVQNSELHNNKVERLERKVRAVRVRRWKLRQVSKMINEQQESDANSSDISYDDIDIGLIKKRDQNNVDGYNQTTLTQMFSQEEVVDTEKGNQNICAGEGQVEKRKSDNDSLSSGTLFEDYSDDVQDCERYDNGAGPLWGACRWSPYTSDGLDDLCKLIAKAEGQ